MSANVAGSAVGSSCPGGDGSQLAQGGSAPLREKMDPEGLMGEGDKWLKGMAKG